MKIRRTTLTPAEIADRLAALELKYGMDSATFYEKYRRGETDDRRDFVRWAGLLNMQAAKPAAGTIRA
jgi:hypothetical protein